MIIRWYLFLFFFSLNVQADSFFKSSYTPQINCQLGSVNEQKSTCTNNHFINTKVFGFSQKEVLSQDGDPNGFACSKNHYDNDLSNRWCHSYFVKLTGVLLDKKINNNIVKHLISSSIFAPKEFVIDRNPSFADLAIVEYPLIGFANGNANISIFGDGMIILGIYQEFN